MALPTTNENLDTPEGQLQLGRSVLEKEGNAVLQFAASLDESFLKAISLIENCEGAVLVCGMGKAGLVGQKIMATFASTGTRSHFLHPAEAVHGDLGRVHTNDVVLIFSSSGQTDEIVHLLPSLVSIGTPIIAVTSNPKSILAKAAQIVLQLGPIDEACSLGLAPSSSTTVMLALGDALALVVSRRKGFAPEDFARNHPGGSLGRKLAKVEDAMRELDECRIAEESKNVREILVNLSQPGRRSGAIMLVDAEGKLSGLFTDSDLAKLFEAKKDQHLDRPITEVMTKSPTSVPLGTKLPIALDTMSALRISELPIVDEKGCPVGMIDVTDVLDFRGPKPGKN